MNSTVYWIVINSFLVILLNGCMDLPDDIIMPAWDVDLNVPIVNKTYTIFDMYKPESQKLFTTSLDNNNFYLLQTDYIESSSEVTKGLIMAEENSMYQSFIFPADSSNHTVFITFPDSIEIEHAIFISGQISLTIHNPFPSQMNSKILIPGIKKPDGSNLVIESQIGAFGRDSIVYDLTNHEYTFNSQLPNDKKNSLRLIASAFCSIPQAYEIVSFYGYNFKFATLTGTLPQTNLGTKQTSSFIDLNDAARFRGKIFFKEVSLKIKCGYFSQHHNNFAMAISDVRVIGKRNNGSEKLLRRSDGKRINLEISNGSNEFNFDESNSNLTDFISFMPDSILITAEYILNPLSEKINRTVTIHDSIKFTVQFLVKSIFALKQTNFIDTLEFEFSQDERDKIKLSDEAELNIHIENSIPLNSFIKATVLDENYNPVFVVTRNSANIDSLYIDGSQVNSITGQVISPTITTNVIKLNSSQLGQLSEARYILISSTVSTSSSLSENPPMVQFKSSDWLKLKCYGKVKYRINSK